jgi:hypothetical protein
MGNSFCCAGREKQPKETKNSYIGPLIDIDRFQLSFDLNFILYPSQVPLKDKLPDLVKLASNLNCNFTCCFFKEDYLR